MRVPTAEGADLVVLRKRASTAAITYRLADSDGIPVGVEFATASVSSPGFEEYRTGESPAVRAASLVRLVDTLKFAETAHRGFLVVTATPSSVRRSGIS